MAFNLTSTSRCIAEVFAVLGILLLEAVAGR